MVKSANFIRIYTNGSQEAQCICLYLTLCEYPNFRVYKNCLFPTIVFEEFDSVGDAMKFSRIISNVSISRDDKKYIKYRKIVWEIILHLKSIGYDLDLEKKSDIFAYCQMLLCKPHTKEVISSVNSLILNDDSLLFSGKLTTLDIVMYSFIKQCFSFQEISNYLKSLEPKMVQYKENINFKTSSKSIVFYLYERFWNNDFLWIGGVLALMGGYSHLKQ
jgi:hypothetical protein